MWYNLRLSNEVQKRTEKPGGKKKDTILKEFAYVYPDPATHSHVKNCITFVRGVSVKQIEKKI